MIMSPPLFPIVIQNSHVKASCPLRNLHAYRSHAHNAQRAARYILP